MQICGENSTKEIEFQGLKLYCETDLQLVRTAFKVPEPEEILRENEVNLSDAGEGTGKSGVTWF